MTESMKLSDGTLLAWDSAGDGPPVVLVHGIGSSRKKWDPQIEPLVSAGFRLYRFDLRGFGESVTPDGEHAMPHFLSDLVGFVDALALDSFHLVGHSLGGMIAQKYVTAHPSRVRSLALVSTTSHNGRRATAFARLMVLLSERGFDAVMNDRALRGQAESTLKEAFPGGVELSMLRAGLEKPSASRADAWRACIDFSAKHDLANVTCPTLVAHGTADLLIPFRAGELVHQALVGSEWLVEEGAGHSLPRERAESFNRALVAFLARAASMA